MPPKQKPQKLTCGGRDKFGNGPSSCTNDRNNHCNQTGGCFRFFCDYCIHNHACVNLVEQPGHIQPASAAITRGAAAIRDAILDDDDSDESYVPRGNYDELTDDSEENNDDEEEGKEEDEYEIVGEKEGSEAHDAWKMLRIGDGDAAERHGLSRKRKLRAVSTPAAGRRKKTHSNKSDPKQIYLFTRRCMTTPTVDSVVH